MSTRTGVVRLSTTTLIVLALFLPLAANGQTLIGSNIPISAASLNQTSPAVAVDLTSGKYLVAWWSETSSLGKAIQGQLVAGDGGLSGTNFSILTGAFYSAPATAFNDTLRQFLVVAIRTPTICELPCPAPVIRGQLINVDGSLGGGFSVTCANSCGLPAVAYNSLANQFLIVWPSNGDLSGQRVNPDGTLAGGTFPISTAAGNQQTPSLAFNPAANEFFVVWQDDQNLASTGWDLSGQRVNPDGTLAGGTFPISTAAGNQQTPSLAFNPAANEFFVVWQDDRNLATTGWDLFGQRANPDGTLFGAEFPISTELGGQKGPTVSYSSQTNRFLVAWQDNGINTFDVFGRVMNADGTQATEDFRITDVGSSGGGSPKSVYNPATNQSLVTWNDFRNGNHDIFGQLVGVESTFFTLTVTKIGTGSGTVISSPPGIDCGSVCTESYNSSTVVTLTAIPDSGSTFEGWGGDSDCTDGQVTMDADKICTATFSGLTGSVPVLIVPGIMGSWSTELFCNDDNAVDDVEFWLWLFTSLDVDIPEEWTIDPILGTYSGLRLAIVQADLPAVDVPYDWRKSIPDIVDTYLIPIINQAKAKFSVDKVDIVAHSMGGLIVRDYIQSSSYRSDIRKFAMIGVPQQGAAAAYYMWEGGNFEPDISVLPLDKDVFTKLGQLLGERFLFEQILENMKQGCGRGSDPDVRFVREEIPSVGQIMPTFPFVQEIGSQSFVPIEQMCLKNDFLPDLNGSVINLIHSEVSNEIFASTSERTLRGIRIAIPPACDREEWPDGEPLVGPRSRIKEDLSGDAQVLFNESAYPVEFIPEFSQVSIEEVSGVHDELPDLDDVTNRVVGFLTE